jgi:hypothetical protein
MLMLDSENQVNDEVCLRGDRNNCKHYPVNERIQNRVWQGLLPTEQVLVRFHTHISEFGMVLYSQNIVLVGSHTYRTKFGMVLFLQNMLGGPETYRTEMAGSPPHRTEFGIVSYPQNGVLVVFHTHRTKLHMVSFPKNRAWQGLRLLNRDGRVSCPQMSLG